uniref:Uncharacterized protein n=1 Tax=uncultured bacterium contig00088 TaxID=1181561 RepID=A0A806K2J6_9BACT|nr:hypothetical protein [uncultured bacterium contig00088]
MGIKKGRRRHSPGSLSAEQAPCGAVSRRAVTRRFGYRTTRLYSPEARP